MAAAELDKGTMRLVEYESAVFHVRTWQVLIFWLLRYLVKSSGLANKAKFNRNTNILISDLVQESADLLQGS